VSFSEDCVRFGDRLRDLVETGVAVKDAAAALGMSGHRCYAILRATGHPMGAPRRRRGRVDRERIVVINRYRLAQGGRDGERNLGIGGATSAGGRRSRR
jgi:hypothetical protein